MTDAYHYATRIVKKLTTAGFRAYFAGGWVRDFLLGHPSADIDIATDASPGVILDLFERTTHVGLNFGVVIVAAGGFKFEVATFRRDISYTNGRKPDSIEMSTPEEDAKRRDFTINGMFYDPLNDVIHDFVQGKHDLDQGIIRTIGDPFERFGEDRLRMIRAIRFANRFGFKMDGEMQEAIRATSEQLLPAVAMERIWQEFTKMAKVPSFDGALITMHRLELLQVIFPTLRGVHLTQIKQRVAPLSLMREEVPPVLALALLFPGIFYEDLVETVMPLRISGEDKQWLMSWSSVLKLVHSSEEISRETWARCYADPRSAMCIALATAMLPEGERDLFRATHEKRRGQLAIHVERLLAKKPLVRAEHLLALGVVPGVTMGQLLKDAEIIAIEEDLNNTEEVLQRLKMQ